MIEGESRVPRVVIYSQTEQQTPVGGILCSTVQLRGDANSMPFYSYTNLPPAQFETQATRVGASQRLLTEPILLQVFEQGGLADIITRLEEKGRQVAAAIKEGTYNPKEPKGPLVPLVEQFALKTLFEEAIQTSGLEA